MVCNYLLKSLCFSFCSILSDCIPIRGRKRIPYLVLSTVLSLLPWLVLGLTTSLRSSRNSLAAFLTVQNFGSAMADVVIDAMIAEAVRSERYVFSFFFFPFFSFLIWEYVKKELRYILFTSAEFAGDLQSLSWSAMALGGICGSLLGGYTLSNLRIGTIFLLFSVLPTIQLLSCTLVEEAPAGSETTPDHNKQRHIEYEADVSFSSANDSFTKTIKSGTSRRKKSSHKNDKKKMKSIKSEIREQQNGLLAARGYFSLKSAAYSLCRAFRKPMILR